VRGVTRNGYREVALFRPAALARLAILIGEPDTIPAYDGAQVTFSQAGCFITCHNSMRAMPKEPSKEALGAHPYWGQAGNKRDDIRKYLLISRTAQDEAGAWDKVKTPQELEAVRKAGKFLDLWQWRAARSNPLGHAGDDWVLDYRWFDKGKNTFTSPGERPRSSSHRVRGPAWWPRGTAFAASRWPTTC